MFLGEYIYNYRMENKITLKQFSERSGLSLAYINQLENNKNPKTGRSIIPSPETFLKVAKAMNMDVDELFRAVDQNQPIHIGSPQYTLSPSEEALLIRFRELNDEGQEALLKQADIMIKSGEYIKSHKDGMVDEA